MKRRIRDFFRLRRFWRLRLYWSGKQYLRFFAYLILGWQEFFEFYIKPVINKTYPEIDMESLFKDIDFNSVGESTIPLFIFKDGIIYRYETRERK